MLVDSQLLTRGHPVPPTAWARTCDQVVARGAIVTLPAAPLRRELVGELFWPDDRLLGILPAFAEKPADVALVEFDEVRVHPFGVCFLSAQRIRALLAPIDKASVEDPDDYQVAWSLWQNVAPARRFQIDRIRDSIIGDCAVYPPAAGAAGR